MGRLAGHSHEDAGAAAPSPPSTRATLAPTTTEAHPAGTRIAASAAVPVGGAKAFADPSTGDPGLIVQPTRGQFAAFDAICPHQGCTVGYSNAEGEFVCPCHGSRFDGRTGALINGPATRGLAPIPLDVGPDGGLYVT